MRSEHFLRFVVVNTLAIGLGAAVATSCIKVNYPTVAFRCNPRQGDNCPATHFCCSDDPSTATGELPAYAGTDISGATPLYADDQNRAGVSGMCVNRDEIPAGFGLMSGGATNCPIPCNPTWDDDQVDAVCGEGFVCCQTVELGEKDCVLPEGESMWRPVTGSDIGSTAVSPQTNWNGVAHDTHQDPNGSVCQGVAMCAGATCEGNAVFAECIRHLTVADQRGFCMGLRPPNPAAGDPGQTCLTSDPTFARAGYQSICDIKSGTPPPM